MPVGKRIDLPPDPYVRQIVQDSQVRNPERLTNLSTVPSQRTQRRLGCRVNIPSPNTIPSAVDTVVFWSNEEFDEGGLHDPNDSKFTIPSTGLITGTWLLHARVIWSTPVAGSNYRLTIRKNGLTNVAIAYMVGGNGSNPPLSGAAMDVIVYIRDPEAGTYYETLAYQDTGAVKGIFSGTIESLFEIHHGW